MLETSRPKDHCLAPGSEVGVIGTPGLILGLGQRQAGPAGGDLCAFDGSASRGARVEGARRKAWGETQGPLSARLAWNVRTSCLSRNLECPASGGREQAPNSSYSAGEELGEPQLL